MVNLNSFDCEYGFRNLIWLFYTPSYAKNSFIRPDNYHSEYVQFAGVLFAVELCGIFQLKNFVRETVAFDSNCAQA